MSETTKHCALCGKTLIAVRFGDWHHGDWTGEKSFIGYDCPFATATLRASEWDALSELRTRAESSSESLVAERDDLAEKVRRISQWADAYPLKVFPEPDFNEARQALEAHGISLDAVSASNMRHVITGVKRILDPEGSS